jgi:hypothetical protein
MDFIQWFICFAIAALAFGVVGVAILTLIHYQHNDDDTTEAIWFYRGVFVSTFSLALFLTLTIPIDLASAPRDDSVG